MTALIVFAHGSPIESANEAVRAVAADPDLRGAVDNAAARGATRAVVLPYFLTLGLHLQRDIPDIVDAARAAHPDVRIDLAPPLDGHPALVGILLDRARGALGENR
jgi:sirohydrochlorin ferrochelatase